MNHGLSDLAFLALAAAEAEQFVGDTSPNPPVGAAIVQDGKILALGAHARAGSPHAEVVALNQARERFGAELLKGATVYVTLEPCNHHGKTPPCTQALIEAQVARVVYGVRDPNPKVKGGGHAALAQAGLNVEQSLRSQVCENLIAPFLKWSTTGKPWVVHKLAFQETNSGSLTMIPEAGQKTFTSEDSLKLAHLERRKSDAILTGIGTVLSDSPSFNVRLVNDHADKKRWIAVVSRIGRAWPEDWFQTQKSFGHTVFSAFDLESALVELGSKSVHRVLVEAGPALSQVVVEQELWDERLTIIRRKSGADEIFREMRRQE